MNTSLSLHSANTAKTSSGSAQPAALPKCHNSLGYGIGRAGGNFNTNAAITAQSLLETLTLTAFRAQTITSYFVFGALRRCWSRIRRLTHTMAPLATLKQFCRKSPRPIPAVDQESSSVDLQYNTKGK